MKKLIYLLTILLSVHLANAQWQMCNFPSGGGTDCFAVSGSNIFAGNGAFGVYVSTDNGYNWTEVTTGLTNTNVTSLAVIGTNIFAGTNGGGVFLSTNNGSSWTAVNNGLTGQTLHIFSLAVIGTNLFAGTFKGLTSQCGGVFLSTDNGSSWTAVNNGIPSDERIYSLAVNGNVLFAGSDQGKIYMTTNNGSSWSTVSTGLPSTDFWDLTISGTDIYAATNGFGIYMSADSGNSWTQVNNGLSVSDFLSVFAYGNNVFAGAGSGTGGVFLTTNNGGLWTAINTGLMTDPRISALAVSGPYLIAGYDDGGIIMRRLLSEVVSSDAINSDKAHISIYPNPNTGKFRIETGRLTTGPVSLEILNPMGTEVFTNPCLSNQKANEVDLSAFSKGIYFIKIRNGEACFSRKIVIQ